MESSSHKDDIRLRNVIFLINFILSIFSHKRCVYKSSQFVHTPKKRRVVSFLMLLRNCNIVSVITISICFIFNYDRNEISFFSNLYLLVLLVIYLFSGDSFFSFIFSFFQVKKNENSNQEVFLLTSFFVTFKIGE